MVGCVVGCVSQNKRLPPKFSYHDRSCRQYCGTKQHPLLSVVMNSVVFFRIVGRCHHFTDLRRIWRNVVWRIGCDPRSYGCGWRYRSIWITHRSLDNQRQLFVGWKLVVHFSRYPLEINLLLFVSNKVYLLKGAMLQYGFLAAVFWWVLIAFNMCVEVGRFNLIHEEDPDGSLSQLSCI